MEPIYPLSEDRINEFRGQLVCIITNDGNRYAGLLSRCSGSRLILNEEAAEGGKPELKYKKRGRKRTGKKRAGQSSEKETSTVLPSDGPGGTYPFGPVTALDLDQVALLYLIL